MHSSQFLYPPILFLNTYCYSCSSIFQYTQSISALCRILNLYMNACCVGCQMFLFSVRYTNMASQNIKRMPFTVKTNFMIYNYGRELSLLRRIECIYRRKKKSMRHVYRCNFVRCVSLFTRNKIAHFPIS